MTDSQSVPLSAIQISADSSAVWDSRTCHAQSCKSRLDHALLHYRFPYSFVTFEIVTFERVIRVLDPVRQEVSNANMSESGKVELMLHVLHL